MILPVLPVLGRWRALTGVLALALALAILAGLAVNIARQTDILGSSSIDNVQWTLSQMDVELLTLQLAIDDTLQDPARLPDMRRRFDIAYSRFVTLQAGGLFASLRQNASFGAAFASLQDFMDRSLPRVDGPDVALLQALPGLKEDLRQVIPAAHRLGTIGVEVFAALSDRTRAEIKTALTQLAILSVVLLTLLFALLAQLLASYRTARRRASEAAETASRLDAVIRASLDPVITLDGAGRILAFSPAGERVFGLAPAQVQGQDFSLLVPGIDGRPQLDLLPGPQRRRVLAHHASGRDFPAELSVSPIDTEGGTRFVVFLADLSAQVEAERALMAARDAALAGEKAKADLLVIMSHEIRTPLNGMIGTVDLMRAGAPPEKQAEYLRIMADSGKLLMRHVNEILDMSRLDSGKAELRIEAVDLGLLIAEVIENQRPASQAQGNRLVVQIAPGCPLRVRADGGRLRQVLLNLLGNAVKFTRGGTITLGLDYQDDRFALSLRDEGIGIAPQDLDRIFDDFVTLDPSFARNATGTGLGLGIVRRILGQMGGTIRVESQEGAGSVFHLSLPLKLAVQESAPPDQSPSPPLDRSLRVLAVEDNDFNRLILREMLLRDGHRVEEACDGVEGLQRAGASVFDLILLDISMPGLDGVEVTQRLRQGDGPNARTPILALTAHAMPEDVRRFHAAGMQAVLFKPLQIADLRRGLAAHLTPLIQAETLAQLAQGLGEEAARSLTLRFLSDMARRLALLPAAERGQLRAEAHHMAGSAGVFGARAMGLALEGLLELLTRDEAAARAQIPALTDLWQATEAAYLSPSRAQASSLR